MCYNSFSKGSVEKMIDLKILKLNEKAVIPSYGSASAAGADLYSAEDEITIIPGETKLVHTGLAMEIPEGYVGLIYARSGIATKRGLAPANKVGVIDSDYRGEIMVSIFNHSSEIQTIAAGERVAQIVITPYLTVNFTEVEALDSTERGSGGFGSTGTK